MTPHKNIATTHKNIATAHKNIATAILRRTTAGSSQEIANNIDQYLEFKTATSSHANQVEII